jgi:hypothetical protein
LLSNRNPKYSTSQRIINIISKMNISKFVFIGLFLAAIAIKCWGHDIEVIEFLSKKSGGVNITANQGLDLSEGFTTCFRVMFYFLNSNFVFNSTDTLSLQITEYLPGRGVVVVIYNL